MWEGLPFQFCTWDISKYLSYDVFQLQELILNWVEARLEMLAPNGFITMLRQLVSGSSMLPCPCYRLGA